MPYKDLDAAREYKRNWYRKKFGVVRFRESPNGRTLDRKKYAREWYRRKAVEVNGSVNVRSIDQSPQSKLEFKSCYTGDCIVWTGASNRLGYGSLYIGKKHYMAHRLAYELRHGSIPDGHQIDHLCRNPSCINPSHLEAVTHKVNVNRGISRAVTVKRHSLRTHCKRGHEFTEDNTYIYVLNGRKCRSCKACWKARKLE